MKPATKTPAYPSTGKLVKRAAKKEIKTVLEVKTSPSASTEAAFNADEFTFSPITLLKRLNQSLTTTEIANKINDTISN